MGLKCLNGLLILSVYELADGYRALLIISARGYPGKSSEHGGGLCAACNLFCYGNKRRWRHEQFPPRVRMESFCSLVLLATWQSTFDVSPQTDCLGRACLGTGMRFEASAKVRGLRFSSAFILLSSSPSTADIPVFWHSQLETFPTPVPIISRGHEAPRKFLPDRVRRT